MSATLLEATNLAKHYAVPRGWFAPKGIARALDGVSFSLRAGTTLAVVGESGCGKSTLARQVTMLERPSAGELRVDGADVMAADKAGLKRLRPLVQMVFQNPYASLNPRKKVGAILGEPLAVNTALGKAERAERSRAMMARVGLRPEFFARYPHMFSGGQRQRIAIARALMLDPRVIVADEVLVMYLGRAVEHGAKKEIFGRPRHPYTRALFASTPHIDPRRRQQKVILQGELPSPLAPPPGCAFNTRCPHAVARCREEAPPLAEFDGRLIACHRAAEL